MNDYYNILAVGGDTNVVLARRSIHLPFLEEENHLLATWVIMLE